MPKSINKLGLTIPVVAASALMLMAPMLASAARPHFVGEPSCEVVSGDLECSGKVAGLGNVENVDATLQADRTCTVRGSSENEPQGLQRGDTEELTVRNGAATFSLTVEGCPDRMTATFSNVAVVVDGTTLPIDF